MGPYTIFQKIIKFGVSYVWPWKESSFRFYISKIQTFLKRYWLNTTINSPKLSDLICEFLICISTLALGLTHGLGFKRYTQTYGTVIYSHVYDDIHAHVPNFE